MFKDKKGFLGAVHALAAATIAVAVLLVVAFFFIGAIGLVSDDGELIGASLSKVQVKTSVLAYLSTTVEVGVEGKKQEILMSDLIRLAKSNKSYILLLEKETKSVFEPVFGNDYGLEIPGILDVGISGEIIPITKSRARGKVASLVESIKVRNDFEVIFKLR